MLIAEAARGAQTRSAPQDLEVPKGVNVGPGTLITLSLWLGVFGFGGGFAVAQRIRRTVVEERGWMSEAAFLEYFAVAGALPGTTATNLLTMIGLRFGGLGGGALSALAFLTPSIVLMLAFGAEYERIRGITTLGAFLDGMSYATVGVVGAVALDIRRTAVKTRSDFAIAGVTALVLSFRWMTLLEVVALAGLLGALAFRPALPPLSTAREDGRATFPPASSRLASVMIPLSPTLIVASMASGSLALFFFFARIGAATFGGGFAMIPPIEHEVVAVRGWMSQAAFNDAMVLGQVTPGPIAIAATFIGYRVDGWIGALAATLGMFGPAFVLSVIVARSLATFRRNPIVRGFLLGVSPAVVGVIAAAGVSLWRTSVHSIFAGAVAFAAFAILARCPKLSPLLPLAAGGLLRVAMVGWLSRGPLMFAKARTIRSSSFASVPVGANHVACTGSLSERIASSTLRNDECACLSASHSSGSSLRRSWVLPSSSPACSSRSLASSRRSMLESAQLERESAASRVDGSVWAELSRTERVVQNIELAIRYGAGDVSSGRSIEPLLFTELLQAPDLVEIELTRGEDDPAPGR
jgi:chromate transporter